MSLEIYKKESANIEQTAYDATKKELFVKFKSFKKPVTITEYRYEGVPESVWKELKQAESLGGFINKSIVKGGYVYEKIG